MRPSSSPLARFRERRALLALAAVLVLAGAGAAFALGGGTRAHRTVGTAASVAGRADPAALAAPLPKAHPHLSEPVAGVEPGATPGDATGNPDAGVPGSPDAQQADTLPQPVSDAQIRRELAASGIPSGDVAQITRSGLGVAPLDAPDVVKAVIQAGNQIAHDPYRFGGGHRTWVDNAYDCSGSISFAFAAAGLVDQPLDSTAFSHWGRPGRGKWITVYANAGHAYANVAGLWFDTVGLRGTGSRWQTAGRSGAGFVARHPPGL